jgi:hypothetical protein
MKLAAWNSGKIMVLVMVTYAPSHEIKRAIVRICLLIRIEDVMLGNEVTSHRVHSTPNKCREDQISKRLPTTEVNHGNIKGYLDKKVDELPITRGFRFEKHRPKSVEEELKENPYGFHDHISHYMSLNFARNVHVNAIYSLEAMVLKVILLEGDRHRDANWEVSKDTEPTVVDWG